MAIPAKPASLLLATDLSARSDRALARAAQLAAHWQAELVLLVAIGLLKVLGLQKHALMPIHALFFVHHGCSELVVKAIDGSAFFHAGLDVIG